MNRSWSSGTTNKEGNKMDFNFQMRAKDFSHSLIGLVIHLQLEEHHTDWSICNFSLCLLVRLMCLGGKGTAKLKSITTLRNNCMSNARKPWRFYSKQETKARRCFSCYLICYNSQKELISRNSIKLLVP